MFSKEQIKDLQLKINKYYEIYDEVHKDLRDIDGVATVDSIMLSLDNALRMLLCRNTEIVLEEVK
jgi:archaellum component FlaC